MCRVRLILKLVTFLSVMLLVSCSSFKYKPAEFGSFGGQQGYSEQKTDVDEYTLEYGWIGGFEWESGKREDHVNQLKTFWEKRASELCPQGYNGTPNIIDPRRAKIAGFKCDRRFCEKYPMVSGQISCK